MDGETEISGATVTVEEYDDDDDDWYRVTAINGTYTLEKNGTYRYSVTAEGYKDISNVSYAPTGDNEEITVPISMDKDIQVAPEDQATVDAVKKIFDKELGVLRPLYTKYTNICAMVEDKLKTGSYASIENASQVKVSVVSSEDEKWLDKDGVIHYYKGEMNSSNVNSKSFDIVLKFSLNGATAESNTRIVTIGWDQKYFKDKMNEEAEQLTWEKMQGSNTAQTEAASNLTLPQGIGSSMQKMWSTITWESSNTDIIIIQKPSTDSPIYAATGKVMHLLPLQKLLYSYI
ncbi:MAG: hypothetical protein V8T31_03920 [Lachnospiraceae bacterium]